MSSHITITKAASHHLEALVAIINAGATAVRTDKEFANWRDYKPAFDAMLAAPEMDIYVALDETGAVVGTYQIHFLKGLAFRGRPRVELESVHVRGDQQGKGVGRLMMEHAEELARAANACLVQLTSNKERQGSHVFYQRLGYDQSHLGYKKMLM
ncbi:N-acetyltransferase [Roseibium aquae]|uniref:N-acetyltransferase n=1 Tax=Roseibium aquae TaxID=1323746 RepID=A0A916TMM0_9HYPH|nr:GNAT family N-acetyltransferase [Roseibium aquae]GGB58998.1 N-acetyltransferase [Roseibium aquae]